MKVQRSVGADGAFRLLEAELDEDLWERYPETMQDYVASNRVGDEVPVVLSFEGQRPAGCGCLRPLDDGKAAELKRMFVRKDCRGRGHAKAIIRELLAWAGELGYATVILETGRRQPEAIALYMRMGFSVIENYGRYSGDPESVCFRKELP